MGNGIKVQIQRDKKRDRDRKRGWRGEGGETGGGRGMAKRDVRE